MGEKFKFQEVMVEKMYRRRGAKQKYSESPVLTESGDSGEK